MFNKCHSNSCYMMTVNNTKRIQLNTYQNRRETNGTEIKSCLFFTLNGICNRIGMTINYWIWVYSYDFVYDAVKDDQ